MNSQMSKDGGKTWEPATIEPYYPSLFEKIWHRCGGHIWEVFRPICVICGKHKKSRQPTFSCQEMEALLRSEREKCVTRMIAEYHKHRNMDEEHEAWIAIAKRKLNIS